MANSLDRLLTYARGDGLSEAQRASLATEETPAPELELDALLSGLRAAIDGAHAQLRATPEAALDEFRGVGRAALPSSVRGRLHHAGQHTARHAGQVVTTVLVLRGTGSA